MSRCKTCGLEDPRYYRDILEKLKQAEARIVSLESALRQHENLPERFYRYLD